MLSSSTGPETCSKTAGSVVNPFNFVLKRALWLALLVIAVRAGVFGQSLNVKVTEYPVPSQNTRVNSMTAGPDGALWFTESNTDSTVNKIGRVTTAGVFTEYPVPQSSGFQGMSYAITPGPDGNLWFDLSSAIGRITTGGIFTRIGLSNISIASGGGIANMAPGSDGAMWFTDQLNFAIGRITTSGVFTEYRLANPCTFGPPLRGITPGPDGAIWFSDICNGSIGRITPAGSVVEFVVPHLQSDPTHNVADSMAVGPDGALWFSESTQSVGRITTDGVVTEYPVGYPTFGITRGPDRAMWLSSNYPLLIRISMTGAVTTYSIPGTANQIVLGSDGALWSYDFNANRILQVQIPARTGVLPHIVSGGGWNTTITLVNNSSSPVSTRLAFYGDDGSSLTLPLNVTQHGSSQGVTASTLDQVIGPNSTLLVDTGSNSASSAWGWADVTSTGPLGGYAIFRATPQSGAPSEGTVPLQSQFPSTLTLAYDNVSGFVMGVALTNLSTTAASITATIWDDSGNQLGTQPFEIAGNGHLAFVLPDLLPLTAGKRGIVKFQSPLPDGIAALGLRFSPFGTFTSVPTMLP